MIYKLSIHPMFIHEIGLNKNQSYKCILFVFHTIVVHDIAMDTYCLFHRPLVWINKNMLMIRVPYYQYQHYGNPIDSKST